MEEKEEKFFTFTAKDLIWEVGELSCNVKGPVDRLKQLVEILEEDSSEVKFIRAFLSGYKWIINEVEERLHQIEENLGLEKITVGEEGLDEFISNKIFSRDRYSPYSYHEDLRKLVEIIIEEFDGRIVSDHYHHYGYYCDELLGFLAFYPGSSYDSIQGIYKNVVEPIDHILGEYLDDDLIGTACPESSPGKTIFKEIMSECCRLHYRFINDGDTGFEMTDPIFTDHVNLIELIRDLPEDDFKKFMSYIKKIMTKFSEGETKIRFYGPNLDYLDEVERYRFDMSLFHEETCAVGASIMWSALILAAKEELISKGLATEETPVTKLDYNQVEFLSQPNNFGNCRGNIIKSEFKPYERRW